MRDLLAWTAAVSAAVLLALSPASAGNAEDFFDDLLKKYVTEGADGINRVDYAGWSRNPSDRERLKGALAEWERQTPSRMQRNELLAYWVNVYNAITLQVVIEAFPVASIRDVKSDGFLDPKAYFGPWRTKRVTIEGKAYSLDDIEHVAVRPYFNDARVHYAVNCASIGCPNLRPAAWRAEIIDAELTKAAKAFVNHPRGVAVTGPGQLKVSSIYEWFKTDFEVDGGVLAHIRKFADPPLASALDRGAKIVTHGYDWSLNEGSRGQPRS